MPIMTFRGEKTVGEIADKMYERLTPKQKEKAEAAILKANPQLADPGKLSAGTILKMPDMAELRPKTSRALENPDALLARHIADALSAYGQRFESRTRQAVENNKEQLTVLKSADLKKALGNAPVLQELAAQLAKTVDARAKDLQVNKKVVDEVLQAMRKDLGQ